MEPPRYGGLFPDNDINELVECVVGKPCELLGPLLTPPCAALADSSRKEFEGIDSCDRAVAGVYPIELYGVDVGV